ncbi:hypothetical protein [Streptomyces sp. TRM64462]|uniref:DUF7848 domain-containing protein n=1 Tax=Streptomyces sp. TRM64462 TaxID=2741726 RepID=UPI0015865742|nr:hypothetical protein [Streptomyces sp. TRM64462]
MSVRTVIRQAEWTIGADSAEGASPPIREVECTTCHEQSELTTDQLAGDVWAMRHAARHDGHRSFREIVTAFLRVTPAPDNPLYQEEARLTAARRPESTTNPV